MSLESWSAAAESRKLLTLNYLNYLPLNLSQHWWNQLELPLSPDLLISPCLLNCSGQQNRGIVRHPPKSLLYTPSVTFEPTNCVPRLASFPYMSRLWAWLHLMRAYQHGRRWISQNRQTRLCLCLCLRRKDSSNVRRRTRCSRVDFWVTRWRRLLPKWLIDSTSITTAVYYSLSACASLWGDLRH